MLKEVSFIRSRYFRVNEEIRAPKVRLVDGEGRAEIIDTRAAIMRAKESGLDLIEVSAKESPPICRIFDFGKFLFHREKQLQKQRKNQKAAKLKEMKFRPKTEEHDYRFKLNHVIEFLKHGDKVKVSVFYKGREITHHELGVKILERLVADTSEFGKIEKQPVMEGKNLFVILTPSK